MNPEVLELLQRHAPCLRLDPLERWAPTIVDGFLTASTVVEGGEHVGGPPARPGATPSPCPRGLHLDPIPRTVPRDRGAAMLRTCGPAPPPGGWRCYGETAPLDDAGRRALRYWCFYPDNPFGVRFADVGRHVGDWELVQVELDPAGALEAVTVFQHGSPQRVPVGDRKLTIEDGRPHVFVAEGSHAAYLTAGSQPRLLKRDNTSADGPRGVPGVVPMPDGDGWAAWCGRWGPDTGPDLAGWMLRLGRWIARRGLGGDSPPGPRGRSRPARSTDASRAAAAGRRSLIARFVVPLLRRAGAATWPRDVTIERSAGVTAVAGRVRLRVRAGGGGLRLARYVDAVVADAQGVVLGVTRARVPAGRVLDVEVAVLAAAGPGSGFGTAPGPPAEVRVAGYNRFDQRSNVDRAAVVAAPPAGVASVTPD